MNVEDKTLTLSLKIIDKVNYYFAMPEHIHEKITIAILRGQKAIEIKESEWIKIKEETLIKDAKNKIIASIATLNNKGISAEKNGNEKEAITYYEKNIHNRCVATHSYDRLMKIYRRLKDYDNEERIVKLAIEVFSIENQRRYLNAIDKLENYSFKDAIEIAHETNTGARNSDGWFIYSPYDVMKYISRIEKITKLKSAKK